MELLSGTYIYGIDQPGSVVMPAPFRWQLGLSFVLTCAPDGNLLALQPEHWSTLVEAHQHDPWFRDRYLATAVACSVDEETGRFLIPQPFRDYAEIGPTDEVAVSGRGLAVQVAARRRWEELVAGGSPAADPWDW